MLMVFTCQPFFMSKLLIDLLLQYRQITTEDQSEILRSFQQKEIKAGDRLITAGSVARQLYFIESGILKITIPHPKEKDMVYHFMKEGQFMTFLYSMYGNIPAQQNLEAACDSEVYFISYQSLVRLYEKLPFLKPLIDEIAQLTMAQMVNTKNMYMTGDALNKYQLFMREERDVAVRVALADIASYLGMTPQSLSRIRRKFAMI
jgi:CRP-like cAMP-binding protein